MRVREATGCWQGTGAVPRSAARQNYGLFESRTSSRGPAPHIQMVNGGDNSNTEFMIFETLALTGWHRRVFQSGSSSATQLHTATHNAQHNAEAMCIEHQHNTQPASSSLSVSEHQYSSYTVTDEFGGEVKWNSSTGRGSFQTQSRIGSQARCDGAASEHWPDVFFLMVRWVS